jgi:hypothetical protein
VGYPRYQGRLLTRYSPVRHSTRLPKKTFAFDLHVLSTPPAFVLSQDQTLQFDILDYPLRDSYLHMCCIYKSSLCITKFALGVLRHIGPVCVCVVIQFSRIVLRPSRLLKAPRYECREELATLTQPNRSVNAFLYSFFPLANPIPGQSLLVAAPVSCSSKSAANYLIDGAPSRGF